MDRMGYLDLLNRKKKMDTQRHGNAGWIWVALVIGTVAALFLLGACQKVRVAEARQETPQGYGLEIEDEERPRCAMTYTVPEKHENHVEFAATWENGSPTGAYPFEFGDGDSTVLTGTNGGIQFSHDYAYIVGGVVTYTIGFTVTNELTTTVCHIEDWIILDDSPDLPPPPPPATMTEKVYLPQMFNYVAPPQAGIWTEVGPAWNHVVIHLVWTGGSDEWRNVYFGDGSSTKVFGAEGDTFVWHDYPYPGGAFTISYEVEGPGGKATSFYIVEVAP